MNEEDERPPDQKLHVYHSSITYNGCGFCLLTPPAILILSKCIFEPRHEISNNVVCATSKASDQPAHTRSLIRTFASRLSIL